MATLRVNDLSLEIAYRDFEHGWVHYDIWLRWRGEPIINDAILKREGDYWAKRGKGAIKACEHYHCGVLPLLRRVLETNESRYWEPLEPDILLAVYPKAHFPFLSPEWEFIDEPSEAKAAREARIKERLARKPSPDDLIDVMSFVDAYNFEGASSYQGSGLCFRLMPTRACLEQFYQDLRAEYLVFRERHRVDAHNRGEMGPNYKEPWF